MNDFTSLNGYNVKDSQARSDINTLNGKVSTLETQMADRPTKAEVFTPQELNLNDVNNFTTLVETIINNPDKKCSGDIGELNVTNLRTLLGNPKTGNYIICEFEHISGNNYEGAIRVEGNTLFTTLVVQGFLHYETRNNTLDVQWSGWSLVSHQYSAVENADINSGYMSLYNGVYSVYNCPSAPNLDLGILETLIYNNDWKIQRWTDIDNRHLYERAFTNGTSWSGWSQRW